MYIYNVITLKKTVFVLAILALVSVLHSCAREVFEIDGFKNKKEIITLIEENIDDLNELTLEMYIKFQDRNRDVVIENSFFKTFNHHNEYKTKLSNIIFDKMRIKYIYIDYNKKRVDYSIRCKFGTYIGFYYSFDDNKNYYNYSDRVIENAKENHSYIEYDNITVSWDFIKHGWYTEKICANWYFYEEDWDYLNFIKYIYDDVVNDSNMKECYQEHKRFFEKYNPHNVSTQSEINS